MRTDSKFSGAAIFWHAAFSRQISGTVVLRNRLKTWQRQVASDLQNDAA